jgi:hypothetical protein
LLDPKEADAIRAVVDRQLDVVVGAEVGLDGDALPVEREGWCAAGPTAAHRGPLEGLQSRLERETRLRIRRHHDGAAGAVDEQRVAVPEAVHDPGRTRDHGDALLAREQRRVRARRERADHDRRDALPGQRHHVGGEQPLDHQDTPRRGVLRRRPVDPPEVPQDPASEVGDVVGALLERRAFQRQESLVQPAEDPPHGSLGADQRS